MPQDFVTWSYLGTFAGMAAATFWLTQKSKNFIDGILARRGLSLETDLLAWAWAAFLTIVVWGQRGDLTVGWNWPLALVNSLFVAIVAMSTHQAGANDGAGAVESAYSGDDMADVTPKLRAVAASADAELAKAKVAGQ